MLELDLETKILTRLDLQESDKDKEFSDINICDFTHCVDIYKHDLYIFDDGSTKILKSKFADVGNIINDYYHISVPIKKENIFSIINRKLIEFFYSSY